jgi:hypothetical protein
MALHVFMCVFLSVFTKDVKCGNSTSQDKWLKGRSPPDGKGLQQCMRGLVSSQAAASCLSWALTATIEGTEIAR